MQFHHVGVAVTEIERHAEVYRDTLGFGRCSPAIEVSHEGVRVAFIEVGPSAYVELVQPLPGRSTPLQRYLATGYYHVCYLVPDMTDALARMRSAFLLVRSFDSEAFGGRRCAFLVNTDGHLVELAEISSATFRDLFESSLAERSPGE
jgi:methylmalonyl-CoA/ethylmalonyl-CoA epimerase